MLLFLSFLEQARSDQVHVFLVESCLMKGLPHPNIHPVIGACIHEKLPPCIIYPYTTEGNLKKFLQKCRISDCNSHYVSVFFFYLKLKKLHLEPVYKQSV